MGKPLDSSDKSNETEVSLEAALSSFLTDEALNDLCLEGNDGIRVPANRCVLSARSKVFRKMLLGRFVEARSSVVGIGYPGPVLQALTEYVLTDTAEILDIATPTYHQIKTLVSLTGAAVYFQLPDLGRKAKDCLSRFLAVASSWGFCVLEACRQEGPSVSPDIKAIAWRTIRNYMGPVKPATVEHLSPAVLTEILQDDKLRMEEYQLFQLLRHWQSVDDSPLMQIEADAGVTLPSIHRDFLRDSFTGRSYRSSFASRSCRCNNASTLPSVAQAAADSNSGEQEVDRKTIALDLVTLIHLEYIDPNLLSTSVATSGLVTTDQLLEAYKKQALLAHMHHGVTFKRPRYMLASWRTTKTTTFTSPDEEFAEDCLQYPPIKSGIYRWTIMVDDCGDYMWLGIGMSRPFVTGESDSSKPQDLQDRSWVYGNDGDACHGGQCHGIGPKFCTGSQVTFTINLLPYAEGNGTLDASLNGGDPFRLFSNLRHELAVHRGEGSFSLGVSRHGNKIHANNRELGFLPSVSMHTPGRVRLLDIQPIKNK